MNEEIGFSELLSKCESNTIKNLVHYILYRRLLIKDEKPHISLEELIDEICKDLEDENL